MKNIAEILLYKLSLFQDDLPWPRQLVIPAKSVIPAQPVIPAKAGIQEKNSDG